MKLLFIVLYIYSLIINLVFSKENIFDDLLKNDLNRNITELIEARGYICQEYKVITPDNYILKLIRIPNKRYEKYNSNIIKPAVLLQHGFEDNGVTWVNQENVFQSLGFYLADKGFDVWIGNSRGTTISNEHIDSSIFNTMYWNFTLNELAEYDLPTFVNFILKKSNLKQLSYIGHSQGTSIGFIAFNSNKDLESKINLFIALGPVARLNNSPITKSVANIPLIDKYLESFKYTSFLNGASFLQQPTALICKLLPNICIYPLELIEGLEEENRINKTRLPVYISHLPGGTSTKNTQHWIQIFHNDFQKYDYGSILNLKYYNQTKPPKYNLSQSSIPTLFYTGTNDLFSTKEDVEWLAPQIKNLKKWKIIKGYTHLDFLWSTDAHELIYDDFLNYLFQYNNLTSEL